MQCVNMVELTDDDVQPVTFGAAELFNFEAEICFLAIVGALDEIGERADFGGHAVGNFAGAGGSFSGVLLQLLPLSGRAADLGGDL